MFNSTHFPLLFRSQNAVLNKSLVFVIFLLNQAKTATFIDMCKILK